MRKNRGKRQKKEDSRTVGPNFLFIGAARCASTWVHECLKEHPDVLVPERPKELNFFNRDRNWNQGLQWYLSFFKPYKGEKAVGEVTPTYLCSEKTPGRIHTHYPGIRMIVCLRNPIDRACSSYLGHVLSGKVKKTESIFEASRRLVFDNQSSIIDHGFYYQHIQRYLRYFNRDQMLILIYEDLEGNPTDFIQKIYRFLEVDSSVVPSIIAKRLNQSFRPTGLRSNSIRWLNQFSLLLQPIMPKAHEKFKHLIMRVRNLVLSTASVEVPQEIRSELGQLYRSENQKLANFLGRDLSFWC